MALAARNPELLRLIGGGPRRSSGNPTGQECPREISHLTTIRTVGGYARWVGFGRFLGFHRNHRGFRNGRLHFLHPRCSWRDDGFLGILAAFLRESHHIRRTGQVAGRMGASVFCDTARALHLQSATVGAWGSETP